MRVLTVIPVSNNLTLGELSYFSVKDVPLGSLVSISVRNKHMQALVVQSADAGDMKAMIRSGTFSLRRINDEPARRFFPTEFVKAATDTADYYATSAGAILSSVIPKGILESNADIGAHATAERTVREHETYALQADMQDRIGLYKSLMRESFARGESMLVVAPSVALAEMLYRELSTSLAERVYMMTSRQSANKNAKIFTHLHNAERPVILVATAGHACLYRSDLGTILIEDEASGNYEHLRKPYFSFVRFFSAYAKYLGARLILSGGVLSTETHDALARHKIAEMTPPSLRARSAVDTRIIDMRNKPDEGTEAEKKRTTKRFNIFDDESIAEIRTAIDSNKRVLVLVPRRGLAPLTVCRDCKTPVLCEYCDAPVTLRTSKRGAREFLCHKCGDTKPADTTCAYCDSWRLDTLGVGIESVEKELSRRFKSTPIHRVDKSITRTDKQVQTAVQNFSTDGGILITTSLALSHMLGNTFAHLSVIASLDAMLSVPSFQIDERVFSLILKLRDVTTRTLLIQTRMPERSVLKRARSGDIANFIREELALRKQLDYPPYTVIVKITATGYKREIIDKFSVIMPRLEPYGPRVFKQFQPIGKGKFALHALLRIPKRQYPSAELTELLRSLQPDFEIRVDIE